MERPQWSVELAENPPHKGDMGHNKKQVTGEARAEFKPHDAEVEVALLGALIVEPRRLAEVLTEITDEDFYDPFHQRIFSRIILFDDDQRAISALSLGASLKNDPAGLELADVPGEQRSASDCVKEYLVQVSQSAPSRPDLAELCRILTELRERREARWAVEDAASDLWKGEETGGALGRVIEVADRIELRALRKRGDGSLGAYAQELVRDVERAATTGRLPGAMTGIGPLDRITGGFIPHDFIVLAGRPGMGKSVVGLAIAKAVSQIIDGLVPEYDVSIFSLEMSGRENAARLIAEIDFERAIREGRPPLQYSKILKGRLNAEDFERFVLLSQALQDWGIKLHDEAKMTMGKIAALARARHQLTGRKGFALIDHLQIVGAVRGFQGNRVDHLTDVTGHAKELAKKIDGMVLGLSQLNRSVEARDDKRPNLGDLRESGSIEQDADGVLFLYRPEYYLRKAVKHAKATKAKNQFDLETELEKKANVLEIDVAKNRSGGTGDCEVFIDVGSNFVAASRPTGQVEAQLRLGGDAIDGLADLAKRSGG